MIRAEGLSFTYPGASRPALEDVAFALPPGALCGVLGANGSGKSTLLLVLAGLFTPTRGRLAAGDATEEAAIRERVALVLQDPDQQIIGATVEEDLLLGIPPRAPDAAARAGAARALAARLGLRDLAAPVHTLSLGDRRKLCIATALRDGPEALALDEPFAGLDYPSVREMRSLLAQGRLAGRTQLVASHDVEPFADLADAWLLLDGGRLALAGTTAEVFPRLRAHGIRPPCAWRGGGEVPPWE